MDPAQLWEDRRGPNANFERFIRRAVLGRSNGPLVWAMDEVDRLFATPFGTEFFGLLRSWHNERALDPTGPWSALTIAIAYATEAHLFITDMNQSPFNVGTRLTLEDFTQVQVAELSRRYQNPIKSQDELKPVYRLVGGLAVPGAPGPACTGAAELIFRSVRGGGRACESVLRRSSRRLLVLLVRDPELAAIMKGILSIKPCPTRRVSIAFAARTDSLATRPRTPGKMPLYAIYSGGI